MTSVASDPAAPNRAARRDRRWRTKKEIAAHLGLTERGVEKMILDGRLRGYRLGRTVRLDLDEVDDALQPYGGAVNGDR